MNGLIVVECPIAVDRDRSSVPSGEGALMAERGPTFGRPGVVGVRWRWGDLLSRNSAVAAVGKRPGAPATTRSGVRFSTPSPDVVAVGGWDGSMEGRRRSQRPAVRERAPRDARAGRR